MIGERQFPPPHRVLVEGAAAPGLRRVAQAFACSPDGIAGAFARRTLKGRQVFLASAPIGTETGARLRFVIGREPGHHAAGHLDRRCNPPKLPARAAPSSHPARSGAAS